jgi:hypothetical protein
MNNDYETSAVRTLLHLGYTFHGGEQWKPPIGKKPSWFDADNAKGQVGLAEQAKPMNAMYTRQEAQRAHRAQAVDAGGWVSRDDHEKALINALRDVNSDEAKEFRVAYEGAPITSINDALAFALDAFLAKRRAERQRL